MKTLERISQFVSSAIEVGMHSSGLGAAIAAAHAIYGVCLFGFLEEKSLFNLTLNCNVPITNMLSMLVINCIVG